MGHSATHAELHRRFNDRQFEAIEEHLAPSMLFEDLPRGLTIKTHEEFVDYLRDWTAGFGDATIGSPEYADGPDHSVATFHARGTNDGPMAGMPATGESMDVPFCEVLHYGSDGKVVSGTLYYDQATLLSQLGVIDLPAPPGEPAVESPGDVVRALFATMDELDFDTIRARMADDAQGVDEISRRWLRGKDELVVFLSQLEGSVTDVRSDISDLVESITGDSALVTCWLDQQYRYQGELVRVSAPTSVCLRRQLESWHITLVHSVPIVGDQRR